IIIYGLVSKASIDQMFIAGILPGFFLLFALGLYSMRVGIKYRVPRTPFSWKNVRTTLRVAAWEIPLPIIILGGIYGGLFTATEAAAVVAFYVLVIVVFVYKDLSVREGLPRVMKESMLVVGAILIIVGTAWGLTNFLIDEQVPQQLFALVRETIDNKFTFLLILNAFLIVVGMMMDIFSALIVVVPLIQPIAMEFGIDPVHLGIIFLTNLEIGYLTPPVGLNLFLSALRFKKSIFHIARSVLVFIAILFVALMVITYVPELSLWLVKPAG
ncbi:MAG TPA: TRAP transporter large permease subunit, partial [Bacteroidota bacterium]